MPDRTQVNLDAADGIEEPLDGPDEDDAEAMYDPGVAKEGASFGGDTLSADADISDNDANHLEIDEEFDSEDAGPEAERLDDRSTSRVR